jgi:tetratricopeptide (TPR) repeat protein
MTSEFIQRIREEILRAEAASPSILAQIEQELGREQSAELWILRGDAIQLSNGDEYDLQDAETSYLKALELDPASAEAYESLGHFTFALKDDARGSLHYFQRAIELGAGQGAREGLRDAMDELAAFDE